MPGTGLRHKDLLMVLDATRLCAEADDLPALADTVVNELPRLVPCDVASYDEIDVAGGGGWGRTNPADLYGSNSRRLSESFDILTCYAEDNPLIPLAMSAPQEFPCSWSDMRSSAELHRTDLYNLIYRSNGVEDQLAALLEEGGTTIVGMTVDRRRRGYSDRDRAVLDLFAGQLKGVRRLVAEADRLRRSEIALAALPDGQADGPRWRLRLLGGFELIGPSGPVRLEGKAAELVKMVALAGGPVVVDRLLEDLWPEADFEVARRRLRGVLHRVPHEPCPVLVRHGEAIALGAAVSVDVAAFETSAARALAAARRGDGRAAALGETALALYRADALPEDAYADWAAVPRERLRRRRLSLLDALASQAERCGDAAGAIVLLAEAAELDPLDETRQLRLGWLYASTGRTAAALGVCRGARRIASELGLAPSSSWQALLDALGS